MEGRNDGLAFLDLRSVRQRRRDSGFSCGWPASLSGQVVLMADTRPLYYKRGNMEVIDIVRYLPFCLGNVVKYVMRAPRKGGVEDCDKALQYLRWCQEDALVNLAFKDAGVLRENFTKYTRALSDHIVISKSAAAKIQYAFLVSLYASLESGVYDAFLRRHILDLRKCLEERDARVHSLS